MIKVVVLLRRPADWSRERFHRWWLDEHVAYGKKLVRESDYQIKGLEKKAAEASGDAKARYNREIKDLKVKRKNASKKLDEMGKASGAAWDNAKNGFADAYRDLSQSFEKAAAQFK